MISDKLYLLASFTKSGFWTATNVRWMGKNHESSTKSRSIVLCYSEFTQTDMFWPVHSVLARWGTYITNQSYSSILLPRCPKFWPAVLSTDCGSTQYAYSYSRVDFVTRIYHFFNDISLVKSTYTDSIVNMIMGCCWQFPCYWQIPFGIRDKHGKIKCSSESAKLGV